jgi:antirestriction protein
MENMRVFIVNLGKYNEGEPVGDWFSLPVDKEVVIERLGLNKNYEEYAVHDQELPFPINEYVSIEELNRMTVVYMELRESPVGDVIKDILDNGWYGSMEELAEHLDEIICYTQYTEMEQLAHYLIDECAVLGELSDEARMYIDYENYARDEYINGNYLCTGHGIFKQIA